MDYDVFNGDADGIISLVQLRRAEPRESLLITGHKRDINLLRRVSVEKGDDVVVLSVSMRNNASDLKRILGAGATVFYVDHHNSGKVLKHPNLDVVIDNSPQMCTSMLIDECFDGDFRAWAVTAAFGENLPVLAMQKAKGFDLPLLQLEKLGILINYNSYGISVNDLHINPADLYRDLVQFNTPMEFLVENAETVNLLECGYREDISGAGEGHVVLETDRSFAVELSNSASSRRVCGVFINDLSLRSPCRAHATLTREDDGFIVNVRAPLSDPIGADTLCLKFMTGGGRGSAAGINYLPENDVDSFLKAFQAAF